MTGRTTNILLVISLVLNIFVIGAVAGGAYVWRRHLGIGELGGRGLPATARLLDPEQRKAFRQAIVSVRREVRAEIEAARASRDELMQLLAQPVLDRAAIDATLSAARAADMNARGRIETAVVDFAANLNAEDRARLAEGFASRGPNKRRQARQ